MKVIKDFILFTMNCPKSGTKLAGCYAVVFFLHFVKNQNRLCMTYRYGGDSTMNIHEYKISLNDEYS
jgi:hypothetical protein